MKYAITLLPLLALALILPACGGGSGGGGGSSDVAAATGGTATPAEEAWALAVLDLVNQERQNNGLPAVAWRDDLAAVAYAHSLDMFVRDFWDNGNPHVNPDGQDPGARLAEAGISVLGWGENIAYGQTTPAAVVTAWMNSPDHRDNILHPAWTHMGVGVHDEPNPGPFWTQVFILAP